MEVKQLIETLGLLPHPEGGYYKETYRSSEQSTFAGFEGERNYCTGIYFLIEKNNFSALHRIKSDEMWHFYGGDPLRLILLYPDGSNRDVILGNEPLKGQLVQFVIPAGVWQAGHCIEGGRYSLFGCTLAPGFTDDIFTGGTQAELLKLYPEREKDILEYGLAGGETSTPEGFAS